MTKRERPRIDAGRIFNPADPVLDSFENGNSAKNLPARNIGVQPDTLRKLTFQIRDSVYEQLKDRHYLLGKQLGENAPDREVIVEEAIVALLDKLEDGEDLAEAIAHRQHIRQQELESGALINPSSRKKK